MITLEHISKTYRIAKRESGMKNVLKSVFLREYEEIHALRDVSFEIADGEIVGYIGPNGAGKSSTIKIMSGILTPDAGVCQINGMIPWKNRKEYVKQIGVVFGQRSQLWWDVPVADTFSLLKDLYQLDDVTYKRSRSELCEMLSIGELLKVPARQLSLGQRMRCEIAASLLHRPSILFLDEPTIGLDAVSKLAVRKVVGEINRERKTTVILTTHDMQDVESLTNRVLLIGKGQVLLDGTMEEWRSHLQEEKRLEVCYSSAYLEKEEMKPYVEALSGTRIEAWEEGRMVVAYHPKKHSVSEIIGSICTKFELTNVKMMEQEADELIVSLYKEYQI